MPHYIVRVELRGEPAEEKYDQLHDDMAAYGFERTISGTDDDFHLPSAMYKGVNSASFRTVRDRVVAIAEAIVTKPRVLVIEYTRTAWKLDPVDED